MSTLLSLDSFRDRIHVGTDDDGRSATAEFNTTVRRCAPLLSARALRLTGSKAEAEDLVQDTMVKGLRALGRYQLGTNMCAWLTRIMLNLFIDHRRQNRRRHMCWMLAAEDQHSLAAATNPVPFCEASSDDAIGPISSEALAQAVEQLPAVLRSVWQLRVRDGQSYAAIARALEIPISTVGTRLARARGRLRVLLGPPAPTLFAEAA